jgi:hypothetical protein
MPTNTVYSHRFRPVGGGVGSPTSSESAELTYNMASGVWYAGFGDNGSGQATSQKRVFADDFWQNMPDHGGVAGKALISTASGTQWGDLPEGSLYTADGTTLTLTGTQFSVNTANIATRTYVDTGLALKANTADAVLLTGNQTIGGTKTFSATISGSINGNAGTATTLATGRTIGITGDLVWTSPSFNGSGNVTAAGTIQAGAVTNAKMANMVTQSFKGRTAAGSGSPEDLTVTQATAMLNEATGSLKGLMSSTDKTKLDGVATGATANSTDATLLARANHTGTQAISTVTNLQTSLDGKAALSHTHGDADITALSATKLTGTIDAARLPAVVFQAPIVSSGGIAALTTPQQDEVVSGSIVVTTDGVFWIYSGSGSKTLEASYRQMADITPEWSAIANKPATFTPSAHTHVLADITNAGTMAAQNANAVAITGGTLDNVTINNSIIRGGTF